MELQAILGHPGDKITHQTARIGGVQFSGTWNLCVHCGCGDKREDCSSLIMRRLSEDIRFVIPCVDVFSMYTFVRFLRKESDAKEGLRDIINDDIAPQGFQISIVSTEGEESSTTSCLLYTSPSPRDA